MRRHIFQTSLLFSLLTLAGLVVSAQKISTEDEIKSDIEQVSCKGSERLKSVIDLFKRMGATDADIAVIEKDGTKNVVVTKKGSGPDTIVVSAHYDKVNEGCGVIDNWTGVVVIAHAYRTLKEYPSEKTLKFIAFDKEEEGLVGSDVFVKQIQKAERASYCADVNLDSFGFAGTQTFKEGTSEPLLNAAKALWTEMKLQLGMASIPGAGADSQSFIKAGIPAITFSGLDPHWQEFLHTSKDQLKNVNVKSVWIGYRLVLPFITEIDKQPCSAFRKKQ
jgi:Zn-dependent M28 family amino/carboxypeptidase